MLCSNCNQLLAGIDIVTIQEPISNCDSSRIFVGFFYGSVTMAKITINQARKILGNLASDVSDEELQQDIETAELLKTLFFSTSKVRIQKTYNKNTNGKN